MVGKEGSYIKGAEGGRNGGSLFIQVIEKLLFSFPRLAQPLCLVGTDLTPIS